MEGAKFISSFFDYKKMPETKGEIAFIGRSNVGKSSLINFLTGIKNIAKVKAVHDIEETYPLVTVAAAEKVHIFLLRTAQKNEERCAFICGKSGIVESFDLFNIALVILYINKTDIHSVISFISSISEKTIFSPPTVIIR